MQPKPITLKITITITIYTNNKSKVNLTKVNSYVHLLNYTNRLCAYIYLPTLDYLIRINFALCKVVQAKRERERERA